MSVALKNDGRQAAELAPDFDFAIVEECFQYHECSYYKNTFIKEGKAVFEAEYELSPSEFCPKARSDRIQLDPQGSRTLRTALDPVREGRERDWAVLWQGVGLRQTSPR